MVDEGEDEDEEEVEDAEDNVDDAVVVVVDVVVAVLDETATGEAMLVITWDDEGDGDATERGDATDDVEDEEDREEDDGVGLVVIVTGSRVDGDWPN